MLAGEAQNPRIQLTLDTAEAEAALAIVAAHKAGKEVTQDEWQRLFRSEPYVHLKKREASLHRDFTDDDFKKFLLSANTAEKAQQLQLTLAEWKKVKLVTAGERILPYLPAEAHIRAKVYPVIKPATNSFVFEVLTDPAIFFYIGTKGTREEFENTAAHELHHIGYSSIAPQTDALLKDLPPNVKPAVEWMGALGEGFAMLAAAGSPDADPHAFDTPENRARWNHDLANFNPDLKRLEKFFLDIVEGRLQGEEAIRKEGFTFFGVQGPWYTVGYEMAVIVENRYGRARLVQCMTDPRKLLTTYNEAAAEHNSHGGEQLALWSPELLEKITAPPLH